MGAEGRVRKAETGGMRTHRLPVRGHCAWRSQAGYPPPTTSFRVLCSSSRCVSEEPPRPSTTSGEQPRAKASADCVVTYDCGGDRSPVLSAQLATGGSAYGRMEHCPSFSGSGDRQPNPGIPGGQCGQVPERHSRRCCRPAAARQSGQRRFVVGRCLIRRGRARYRAIFACANIFVRA